MKAIYSNDTIFWSTLVVILVSHIVCIGLGVLISGFLLSDNEAKLITFMAIYYICSYELLFHAVDKFINYFHLFL